MRSSKYGALSFVSVLLIAAFLAFSAGCQGDKGKAGDAGEQGETGAAGPTGPIGPAGPQLASVGQEACSICHGSGGVADVEVMHGLAEPAGFFDDADPQSMTITFTSLTVGTGTLQTKLVFDIDDQDGNNVTGLDTDTVDDRDLRFVIAQLTPASGGNSSYWQNYVLSSGEPTYEAGASSFSAGGGVGTLVESPAGTYTYSFKTDVAGSADVTYSASNTQRVVIQSGGDLPSNQFIADFSNISGATAPDATDDGEDVTGTLARTVVNEASCNECHNPLSVHGSRRKTAYCSVCHTPQLEEGEGDLKHFIHKIHRGRWLPSVVAGGTYEFPEGNDWSDVGFPMFPLDEGLGIQNCTKCHDSSVAADADNWKTVPTIEACGSCHDDVNFATGANHGGGIKTNANCVDCHGDGESDSPENKHNVPALLAAALNTVEFNIISATYSDTSGAVTVTFSFTNPSNSDAAWDITTADPFDTELGASINLSVAWDSSKDFFNEGSGSTPARSLDTSVLGSLGTSAITDNGDGTYTMVVALPDEAQASGSGMVFLQGHPLGDLDGDSTIEDGEEMPTTSVSMFFAINDSSATARREIVDIDKCDSCHGILSLHGANRNDNINVCAACHNPNHTDVNRRPEDPSDAVDGKGEESIDFKRLIHAVHASGMREEPIVVYGFGGSTNVFDEEEVTFPGELNACDACHVDDAFTLPLADDILASTIDSGDDPADPADDLNITQNAAVCSSCHDGAKERSHMEQNGAAFDVLDENILFY